MVPLWIGNRVRVLENNRCGFSERVGCILADKRERRLAEEGKRWGIISFLKEGVDNQEESEKN